jgi:hypothetical protein
MLVSLLDTQDQRLSMTDSMIVRDLFAHMFIVNILSDPVWNLFGTLFMSLHFVSSVYEQTVGWNSDLVLHTL